ncbi:MAG: histidine--tRNA ligase [Pseudomonadota bacterium]
MAKIQPARGTRDIYGEEARRHAHVIDTSRAVASRFGFDDFAPPIFEFTDVFKRTLGETSDVVSKEMYSFDDRGGDSITLRPEGTAGIARAFISEGLSQHLPLKYFYQGPMFRYERPQKGRYRQFHQIGVELLGIAQPLADVEVIACGARILDSLGLQDLTTLELNTLGDTESRTAYRDALVTFFEGHKSGLSDESRERLAKNPLRILDSKDSGDRAIIAEAPVYSDFLNPVSRDFFDQVRAGLDALGIAYTLNTRLVRGLDYYCHTAFEFVTDALGAQGAVLAGGRYDGLIGFMGGPETPGVGWAGGIERLAMLLAEPPVAPVTVALVPLGEAAEKRALPLADSLRSAGIRIDLGFSGNLGKRMKRANKINAALAIILGDDELANNAVKLRDLHDGSQQDVPLNSLSETIIAALASKEVPGQTTGAQTMGAGAAGPSNSHTPA